MIKQKGLSQVYLKLLIAFTLFLGFALTIFGLNKLSWPQSIVWSDAHAMVRFVGFLVISAIFVSLLTWKFQRNTGLAVFLTVALVALVSDAAWPLLVTFWFAVASSILGYWLLGQLKIKTDNWLNSFLVGAGLYGTVVGLLAHYPVNYSGVYGVALALPLVLGWRVAQEKSKSLFIHICKTDYSEFGVNWLEVAIGVVALVYVVVALMPEVGFDALAMHLFIPAHLAQRHQWGFDASTYVWAVMPMLGDWIFSMGYMLAGETAARLINVGFIFVLGGLIRNMVLWAGGTPLGARWAILIFLSMPLTFTEGSSLYIESIWASFAVAGALALLRACATSGKARFEICIAGLLLGAALAAKAVTFTLFPVLLLLLFWRYKSWYKATGLQFVTLGLSLFLVIGLMPYATAWWLTENPVFPLFNKIFQSPFYLIAENFNNQKYNSGFTWDVLYRVTFKTGKYLEAYPGASGFQWLLLFLTTLVSLVATGHRRGIALLLVGILPIAMTFQSQSYLRYIFPFAVVLIATIGVALSRALAAESAMRRWWIATAILTVALNLLFINTGNAFYQDFPLKSIFDQTSRERYLLSRLPIRNAVQLVNQLNIDKAPVAIFTDPLSAGLSGDELYPGWYNISFQKEIASVQDERDLVNILFKRGVNFIILDSSWNGINCCGGGIEKQALIEKVSEKIAEYGSISVRKVKTDYRFKRELLSNPDFKSIQGWTLTGDAKFDANTGIVLASVSSPVVQKVAISPRGLYLNTVVARCSKLPTLGRVQINWFDSKKLIVSTDIKTFECSPTWAEQTMEVSAPANAVSAEVYIAGQSPTPLEFKSNSLRQ